jgi:hypothetical protein
MAWAALGDHEQVFGLALASQEDAVYLLAVLFLFKMSQDRDRPYGALFLHGPQGQRWQHSSQYIPQPDNSTPPHPRNLVEQLLGPDGPDL